MSAILAESHDSAIGPSQIAPAQASIRRPRLLVGIASYGTGQDHFLKQVVAQYRDLDMDCRIVVLSNIDKPVDGAEVRVGLPSSDTYSLPFAHRPLFREFADDFDLFIYTEDDTLITPANIRAFLEVQALMRDDEIVGFLRSETNAEGTPVIVSANSHFRWLPNTAVSRGPYRFARFSNQHSGCFIVTRSQLVRAIASGGFTTEPRKDRYGMLETAASDIYTQCGLRRLICVDRIGEFIVPHLANKYFRSMGVPAVEFCAQARAAAGLTQIDAAGATLFEPETAAPDFRWSKNLYQAGGDELLGLVPSSARRVLSVGATMGHEELELRRRGHEVTAMPLDAVFGDALQRQGFAVRKGPMDAVMASLAGAGFDAVLIDDVLHLLPEPGGWLAAASRVLAPGGSIVGSVSNTSSWLWPLRDWRNRRWRWVRPRFEFNGAQPMSEARLRSLCRSSGLELAEVRESTEASPRLARLSAAWLRRRLAPKLLFRIGRRH